MRSSAMFLVAMPIIAKLGFATCPVLDISAHGCRTFGGGFVMVP